MSGTSFRDIFKGQQNVLEEKIDVDHGLLSKLEEYGVITRRHRDAIEVICIIVVNFYPESLLPFSQKNQIKFRAVELTR